MPVMLLQQLSAPNGDSNGSRYLVDWLGVNIIVVAPIDNNWTLINPPIDCDTSDCVLAITMRRRQFPLRHD